MSDVTTVVANVTSFGENQYGYLGTTVRVGPDCARAPNYAFSLIWYLLNLRRRQTDLTVMFCYPYWLVWSGLVWFPSRFHRVYCGIGTRPHQSVQSNMYLVPLLMGCCLLRVYAVFAGMWYNLAESWNNNKVFLINNADIYIM